MNYLYHAVPQNFKGEYLMPLNDLKNEYPDLYKEAIKKYEGRQWQYQQKAQFMDGLWLNCINLSALEPEKVIKTLMKAGFPRRSDIKWFKIDPRKLDKDKMVVFVYPKTNEETFLKKSYKKFKITNLKDYSKTPKGLLRYYKECRKEGKKPLLWHLVDHILYKGRIPLSDMEVLEIK